MFCPNCGHKNNDNAKFCVGCGSMIPKISQNSNDASFVSASNVTYQPSFARKINYLSILSIVGGILSWVSTRGTLTVSLLITYICGISGILLSSKFSGKGKILAIIGMILAIYPLFNYFI